MLCNWPATTTLTANVSLPPRWHVYLPLSEGLTEARHRVSPPLISWMSPQSLSPAPTSCLFHFHWGLHQIALVTLLPSSPSSKPASVCIFSLSQSVTSSAVLVLVVGWTMSGEVLFLVFFRFGLSPSAEVLCWRSAFAVLWMDGFCPVVDTVLLCVTVGTLAVEVLLLVVCGPFLARRTFAPFTLTRPPQVTTSLLPGDKTRTPGGGSSHKNKH